MIFEADKKLVSAIDEIIWKKFSIRTELEYFISEESDFFYEMIKDQFDEEFDYFGGQIIKYSQTYY